MSIISSAYHLVPHIGTIIPDSPVLIPSIFQVVPAVDPCASDALFESDALTGDSYTWKTNLPAGTQVMVVVDDDAGNEAWSAPVSLFEYL